MRTCSKCKEKSIKHLCIDHNHTTGKVRGLLCQRCNTGLGMAKGNINTLNEMISYLQRYSQ